MAIDAVPPPVPREQERLAVDERSGANPPASGRQRRRSPNKVRSVMAKKDKDKKKKDNKGS